MTACGKATPVILDGILARLHRLLRLVELELLRLRVLHLLYDLGLSIWCSEFGFRVYGVGDRV